ncbi:nuclear transport factor 2 family protein [Actinomadura rudentiformis]|uniref:Nuclear transport factor 2 family protein n=1 Tax=Actinomadura rudentiformis TaxID=359158 RepID=A0A6H9Z8Y2_9ACTN|nr:nuclear transport factor 2 family protein [Actinomadura rudentiformis]KAB2351656.1 nuclear transport factor 2 family protein [Actinomadura rudentiformis]
MSINELVQNYLDVWNERDTARRAELMKTALTDDSIYSDPDYAGVKGHSELSAAIDKAQAKFGDLVFSLGTLVNVHHDKALFRWRLGPAGADSAVATGYDYVEIVDGRFSRVIGFFE